MYKASVHGAHIEETRTGRRRFIAMCSQLPLVAVTWVAVAKAEEICADPDALSGGEQALRASLDYTDRSADAAKACGGCTFFMAGGEMCGNCQILGGPVDARGHCSSWTAKG